MQQGEEEEDLDVIVAGGGVGGVALGLMLARTPGMRVAVLERDGSFGERRQGYGLTLQHHDAVRVLGGEELERQIREEDTVNDAHFIFGPEGQLASVFGRFLDPVTAKKKNTAGSRYNVHLPRQRLREHLVERLEKMPGKPLRWGWRVESFVEEEKEKNGGGGSVRVEARHGATGENRAMRCRVLVGADGIHSNVRAGKMKTMNKEDPLRYLGMLVVLGMTASRHPLCVRSTFQTLDGTTRLFCMPFTLETTFWQLSFPCPEQEALRLRGDPEALRAELLRRCASWHEPVPELIRQAPAEMVTATPVYDRGEAFPFLREGPSAPLSCVTLIGDAAHPMSPFKGQGANQALLDAVLLGQALASLFSSSDRPDRAGLERALREVERKMYERSEKKVQDSRATAVRLHASQAALDPATRGISEPMLKMFQEENIGASTVDLRARVIECLKKTSKQ